VGAPQQPLQFLAFGTAIEIAHQNNVTLARNQLGKASELALARAASEREMHDQEEQRLLAAAETHAQRAPARDHAGQAHLGRFARAETAEQPQAVLSEMAEIAIGLVVPIGKAGPVGEIFRLIDERAAQTAG